MYIKTRAYGFVNIIACPKGLKGKTCFLGSVGGLSGGTWVAFENHWLEGSGTQPVCYLQGSFFDQGMSEIRDLRVRDNLFQLSCLLQQEFARTSGERGGFQTDIPS